MEKLKENLVILSVLKRTCLITVFGLIQFTSLSISNDLTFIKVIAIFFGMLSAVVICYILDAKRKSLQCLQTLVKDNVKSFAKDNGATYKIKIKNNYIKLSYVFYGNITSEDKDKINEEIYKFCENMEEYIEKVVRSEISFMDIETPLIYH